MHLEQGLICKMLLDLNMSYTQLPADFYTESLPMKLNKPVMLISNNKLANQLAINLDDLHNANFLNIFSADPALFKHAPIAMAYSGHQFGHLSPLLGDGRAVLLGESIAKNGKRFDIHLKGSGRTAYSRRGDGKSTLRAALKEYIFSESLAGLGIPTTRSLAVVTTGETIRRDKKHAGAILFRTASSHIRIGTFVYASLLHNIDSLKALTDYTIAREYPEINLDELDCYEIFLDKVISRQANLIAKWMTTGFIHGVMNTDNMTISGETIDFGPCAFMDSFNRNQVYSSIDEGGRYAWNKQPEIALWNLSRFAETLLLLLNDNEEIAIEKAKTILERFVPKYLANFQSIMTAKLGLNATRKTYIEFIEETFTLLQKNKIDYTDFFRKLTRVANGEKTTPLMALFKDSQLLNNWLTTWTALRDELNDKTDLAKQMCNINPIFIPRSYLVEEALEQAANENLEDFNQLLQVVQNPYQENTHLNHLSQPAKKSQSQIATYCET